jgi:hypothetical protein
MEVVMARLDRRRSLWLLGLAFVLAGCGSSGDTGSEHRGQTGQATASAAHAMESMESAEPIAWPASRPAPKLALTATPDPMGGFNLRVKMANFRLAPEHTGGKPAAGEGHLHLYVDGQKLTRMYGSWFYLEGLAPGAHALRVDAVANNHAPYHRKGNPIFATTAVQVG